jgi:glutamate carboxypeptidase
LIATKQHIANSILDYFKDNRQAMVDFLKKLVAIETPSSNKNSQNKILKFLEDQLQNLDLYTVRVPGKKTGGYLYARPSFKSPNKSRQLLLGHCDTVWDINTLKDMPITQRNGKMTGPGIYDMKAGLTQIIFSLKAIKDLSLELKIMPLVFINSDEEIGSIESTPAIERLSKIVNRAFVMEPPLGLEGKLKTARKGIGRFTVTIKGKAAHAGLDPEKGVNAIVELSHQVQKLFGMNDFERGITVNVGLIQGGYSPNVIASESKAVIDVRVLNHKDGEFITKKIQGLKPTLDDIELTVKGAIGRQPMEKTPRNRKLWKLAKNNAKLIGISLQQATSGGGSDGNTTSLFTATLDGLGTTGDGAHAEHEFIYIDKLIERTTLLTLLLIENVMDSN